RLRHGGHPVTDSPIRVLVVDDDAHARELHARFVAEQPGFVMAARAGSGTAAIELSQRGDIDLILLDLRLPDVSGIEVMHRIRTLAAHSPDIIVISSSRDQITVRQALAGRVAGYLVTPFSQEVFAERLAAYRAGRAAPDPRERRLGRGQGEPDRLLQTGPSPAATAHAAPGEPPPAATSSTSSPAARSPSRTVTAVAGAPRCCTGWRRRPRTQKSPCTRTCRGTSERDLGCEAVHVERDARTEGRRDGALLDV